MNREVQYSRHFKAAKRFFKKVLKARHNRQPRVINVDKNAAYPPAIEKLKEDEISEKNSELRQVKYLNNLVKKDHRSVKRITNASLGYKSSIQLGEKLGELQLCI